MIALLNKSTRVPNTDVQIAAGGIAHQLRYHAAPLWGMSSVPVIFYADEAQVPKGAWKIVVFDNADQAGVLGWHTEGPDGLPYGRVFASPCLDNNVPVSSVLSHEVLEAFVDPACNRKADDGRGRSWMMEVGDPVESDAYPVSDDHGHTVVVSDFVGPAWFDPQAPAGARFDWLGKVKTPFTLARGGYAVVSKDGQSSAVFGEQYPEWRKELKSASSRTARALGSA